MKLKNLLALILLDYKSSVSVNTDVWVVPTVMKTQIEIEIEVEIRDGRPVPRGPLPAGKGEFPAPPRAVGRGGSPPRPAP